MAAFEPDGSFREPSGPQYTVRGTQALREFFTRFFSAGGGIGLEHCTVTDDGTRCALEYNCVRWGSVELPPRPAWRSTSVARPGGWPLPGSTTTSRHPSRRSKRTRPASPCANRRDRAWRRGR